MPFTVTELVLICSVIEYYDMNSITSYLIVIILYCGVFPLVSDACFLPYYFWCVYNELLLV